MVETMAKRNSIIVSLILIAAVIAAVVYFQYIQNRTPMETPTPSSSQLASPSLSPSPSASVTMEYYCGISALNAQGATIAYMQTYVMNTSQGANLRIDVTFNSVVDEKVNVTLENLKIYAFNSSAIYSDWDVTSWNTSINQERVLNYSFSQNEVTLQPKGSNSVIVEVNVANDAPSGSYAVNINLDSGKLWLGIIVAPSAEG